MSMRLLVVSLVVGFAIFAMIVVGRRANAASNAPIPAAKVDLPLASASGKQTAVFAGGCFWGTQAVFQRVKASSIPRLDMLAALLKPPPTIR